MLTGSIRLLTASAVFAFAAHAAGIGVSGSSCSGDPSITTEVFTIQTDSNGDFCASFTNNIPSGTPGDGSGPPIFSFDFVSGLSAGSLASDYTCFSDLFSACTVSTDTDNSRLDIRFFNTFSVGNTDVFIPRGLPNGGDPFWIGIQGFTPNQSFEVDVNQPSVPEPGSVALLLGGGLGCLLLRRKTSDTR